MKLIIYGDSFAGPTTRFEGISYCWGDILAKKLNVKLINKAIAGSSLEYSVITFVNDCHKNFIEKNDIIIFLMTHTGRLHLKHQRQYPKTATQYQDIFYETTGIKPDTWYEENRTHIKWYEENKDTNLLGINFFAYTHMFEKYAKNNKDNIFILLNSFPIKHKNIVNCETEDNFLYPNINLFDAANLEFNNFSYQEWVKFAKSDPRSNHFSNINLEMLAKSLYDVIKYKNAEKLTYESFQKNIFNIPLDNLKIYESYIENNLLFKSNKYIEIFKKL